MDSLPSYADPPFAVAPDMILALPAPPSVNRTRKLDFSSLRVINAWKNVANAYVLAAKQRKNSPLKLAKIPRFELHIVMSDRSRARRPLRQSETASAPQAQRVALDRGKGFPATWSWR